MLINFDLRSAGRTTKSPDVQSRGKFLNSVATHLYVYITHNIIFCLSSYLESELEKIAKFKFFFFLILGGSLVSDRHKYPNFFFFESLLTPTNAKIINIKPNRYYRFRVIFKLIKFQFPTVRKIISCYLAKHELLDWNADFLWQSVITFSVIYNQWFNVYKLIRLESESGIASKLKNILDSERSDECIDFTMMCVFIYLFIYFVSVYSITSRNNAPILNFGEVKSKHFPTVFKKIEKNKKKMTEKQEILHNTSFRPNRFFYMVVIQKLTTENT
ncbi:Uncharacterized protein FWK35_00009185 [Aphis craccivora]|uniref:Uncharacterized protein n=1 Tax=Aphis craccivora TaxID=307492 RepID=A0A6G0Y4E0_APHCR|nr:Uncharacterized protein FWK35_00009185 [Aphis craccivora]